MYSLLITTLLALLLVAPLGAAPAVPPPPSPPFGIDPVDEPAADGATAVQHDRRLRKRQFDVNVEASFEETLGAELSAELSGTIWRNEEGTARLDGSATYGQHFNTLGGGGVGSAEANGNARTKVSFRYHHD